MSLTSLIVPTYTQMLGSLSRWLQKAQQQMPADEAEALLSARLAPDMFPLSTQIRFACVQVHEAISRLQGAPLSPVVQELLEEGRNAADKPGTLADAQTLIDKTLTALKELSADALDANSGKPLVHELPNGMILDLTAEQYARDWLLSQFYFHVMIAYAILRNNNVEIGKADYVAHMFPYIRPETIPKG